MLVKPKSDTVRACGGYADQSWASPEEVTEVTSTRAFLFRFTGDSRERARIREGETANLLCKNCGPVFAGGLILRQLNAPAGSQNRAFAHGRRVYHASSDGLSAVGSRGLNAAGGDMVSIFDTQVAYWV